MTARESWAELRQVVAEATPRLLSISDADSARSPRPGAWSPRQVLGHLVDSASNNHGRFVRAQLQDELVFPGYAQDEWVRVQRYQERGWRELVELWRTLNLHLAEVIRSTPEQERLRTRRVHNLDAIAFRTVPASEPTTLDYFQRDYVDHLRHHLAQALR
jgi:hypothetical protein